MEVKLDKRYDIAASAEQAWAVLQDIRTTAACMPGAQITEQVGDSHYKGTVKSKVGPAVMQFAGDIEVQGIDAAAMQLKMLGKGADKGGSSASMQLTAHLEPVSATACALVGVATITVSGKLAQFGSRLLVPVSDAMLAQFADNFRAAAAAVASAQTAALPVAAESAPSGQETAQAATDVVAPEARTATPSVPAPAVKELNVLSLAWIVIKGWFAGLFGRKAS
jgi:uncharacterized protein